MIELLNEDAFDVLARLEPESFDAVITDPPYSSGGKCMARKQGKLGAAKYVTAKAADDFDDGTRDQMAHRLWSIDWMRLARRAMKEGAWLMVFSDWRQLPLICNAVQCAGFVWQGINIWHKPAGMPQLGRFYRADEFIVLGTKGTPAGGASLRGTGARTYSQLWEGMISPKEKYHATAKPVALMRHLMQPLPPGARVLDPFAGGGTTLVAARQMGLDALGVEITPANYQAAKERLAGMLPLDGAEG